LNISGGAGALSLIVVSSLSVARFELAPRFARNEGSGLIAAERRFGDGPAFS
jgi:hypothetical protein